MLDIGYRIWYMVYRVVGLEIEAFSSVQRGRTCLRCGSPPFVPYQQLQINSPIVSMAGASSCFTASSVFSGLATITLGAMEGSWPEDLGLDPELPWRRTRMRSPESHANDSSSVI